MLENVDVAEVIYKSQQSPTKEILGGALIVISLIMVSGFGNALALIIGIAGAFYARMPEPGQIKAKMQPSEPAFTEE